MQITNNTQLNQDTYLNLNQASQRSETKRQINNELNDATSLKITQDSQVKTSGISHSIDNISKDFAKIQISDQALGKQSEILDQVKEKLLQTSTSQEKNSIILNDIQNLLENFNDIASNTNYNEETLLQSASDDSSETAGLQFQVNENSEDIISSESIQSNTTGVGLDGLLNHDVSNFTSDQAKAYLETVDNALTKVNDFRDKLASTQNQLEGSSQNLLSELTQTNNSTSVLQEVNYGQEVANFSKQNILAQIGAYGAAQSNNINQSIVTRLLS